MAWCRRYVWNSRDDMTHYELKVYIQFDMYGDEDDDGNSNWQVFIFWYFHTAIRSGLNEGIYNRF